MSAKRAKKTSRRAGRGRRRPKRRGRFGGAGFFVIVAVVLGLTGYFLRPVLFPSYRVKSGVIQIRADMGGFSTRTVRVKAGQPVTIRLTSLDTRFHLDGGGKHQFAIDELGVNIIAPPRGSASQTFTPTRPGVYTFYCSVCCGGRANPSMNGKLIVEA